MEQFIAIIRGINVGGHNRVNMQVLREALVKKKLQDVQTYIQSGNIVFKTEHGTPEDCAGLIREVLKQKFKADVPVLVRSEKEWRQTIKKNPFLKSTDDHTKLLVTFLPEKPLAADVKALSKIQFPHDEFKVVGADIYLHCKNGYGRTDISNTFYEKHLKMTNTTRNWRSVLMIAEMLS
jgi:uncharacterized protein (DUF1697 family)